MLNLLVALSHHKGVCKDWTPQRFGGVHMATCHHQPEYCTILTTNSPGVTHDSVNTGSLVNMTCDENFPSSQQVQALNFWVSMSRLEIFKIGALFGRMIMATYDHDDFGHRFSLRLLVIHD